MQEKEQAQERAGVNWTRAVAVAALVVALMTALAVGLTMHAHSVYSAKDDAYRLLGVRSDTTLKTTRDKMSRAQVVAVHVAVKSAKSKQLTHDQLRLKHKVAKMQTAAKHAVKAAFKKGQSDGYNSGYSSGYGSGQTTGYSSGKDDGYDEGSTDAFTFCYLDDGYIC